MEKKISISLSDLRMKFISKLKYEHTAKEYRQIYKIAEYGAFNFFGAIYGNCEQNMSEKEVNETISAFILDRASEAEELFENEIR